MTTAVAEPEATTGNELLTIAEVANLLSVSPSTVDRYVEVGIVGVRLSIVRQGRQRFVSLEELGRFRQAVDNAVEDGLAVGRVEVVARLALCGLTVSDDCPLDNVELRRLAGYAERGLKKRSPHPSDTHRGFLKRDGQRGKMNIAGQRLAAAAR